jgi:hypothetical protein
MVARPARQARSDSIGASTRSPRIAAHSSANDSACASVVASPIPTSSSRGKIQTP